MIRRATGFTTVCLVALLGAAVVLPETERPAEPTTEFSFTDPEITESSGLVALGAGTDLVVTMNDSGDEGRVFVVDTGTGDTVGVTRWEPEPDDLEALAPVPPSEPGAAVTEVWAADIGDNFRRRDDVRVLRVPVGPEELTVDEQEVTSYRFTYPGGARDAETLLAHPVTGRLYVASKGFLGGQLYQAPERLVEDGTNELVELIDLPSMLTDGAFLPDGRHLVLRSYRNGFVYSYPDLEPVGEFSLPRQRQGEGLAAVDDSTLLLSTEGRRTDVLRVRLPDHVLDAMDPGTEELSVEEAEDAEDAAEDAGAADEPAQPGARDESWVLAAVLGGAALLIVLATALWRRRSRRA